MPKQIDRLTGSYPYDEGRTENPPSPNIGEGQGHNPYGYDLGNSDYDDNRFIDLDYSIGGGVTMKRNIDHGFHSEDLNDRIRGTMGTKRGEHFGKGPKDWKKADERIYVEVCDLLTHDPYIDASEIEVKVEDGIVHLTGIVEDRPTKREAERCVEKVLGIKDIFNEIHVR